MKQSIAFFIILFTTFSAQANPNLKLEGSCLGTMKDGNPIEFRYFSNFDGCQNESRASVQFQHGSHLGSHSGTRSIGEKDIYTFAVATGKTLGPRDSFSLSFANSTGNTEGMLNYLDSEGSLQSIVVQCEVRDYEYERCE